ncbi:MAG: hypothetical protein ABMA01_03175 [Chthoniobacteraceae bacterium]
MEILPIEIFGVAVDIPFPTPLGFQTAKLEDFAAKICDAQTGLGLRADQIRLRKFDDLFDYELKANFFGENGNLNRTADRVKFGVRNARTDGDWKIIHQSLTKLYKLLEVEKASVTHLSTHVHAKFDTAEEREKWLGQFSHNSLVDKPAALGYVRIQDWEKDIRILIEQSNAAPNAVFVAWDTHFTNNQEWDSFLGTLPNVMENSANFFELGFEPFKERV